METGHLSDASCTGETMLRSTNNKKSPYAAAILLVDGHWASASALSLLLQREGYRVRVADNSEQALHFAQLQHFDLVVTDVSVSNAGLMAKLKYAYGLKGVGLSNEAEFTSDKGVEKLGFAKMLSKPVDFRELFASVHTLLS